MHLICLLEKRKQEILRSMLKARKDKCCIKVRYGKVLFCGAGAAGKTNFLNLLMKKDFEQKHKSTELVKPQQVTIAMKALVSSNHNEIAFTTMDIDEEIHQLMSYLPKKYTEQTLPHHADPQHTVQEDVSQNSYTTAEDIMSEKLASDSELTKQVAKHEWNILTFMDTGGQPQFISMLPTVNSFAMITFIVHKMAKGEKSLDNNVMVQHGNQQGENSFPPHSYECTYLQLIKTLMTYASSVLFPDVQFLQEVGCKNTKNTNSNISIIGTHSADVSADDIKKIDKALADMIDNAGCKNVKPNLNEEYEYLIPVDNKDQINRNKSDSDTVIDIKKYTNPSIICKHIYDFQMQQDVYSVPIQWLLLELEIRKVCIDKECCFITYKDVLNLATKKNLGDEDFIKNGLRFHHLFGVLLYFENVEGMCELIITNHQWLFDKLTEIVHYSFKCATKGDRDELRIGIFKDAMLEELKIEKDFKNANIDTQLINPKKAFLNLLKHLKIVVPLNEDETKYFMPSILKSHPLTDAELEKAIPGKNSFKHQSNENAEAEPFLFQLESTSVNLIPRGFFCFLIVELICSTGWRPYKKNLYDNLVTFFKVEGGYFVTIIDKIFFLEVRITHENGNVIPIHYGVLKIMHNTMVEVEKNLCIRCIIKHGFLCKKCSDTEQQHLTYLHMTHVDEDGIKYVSPSDSMGCDCINERLTSIESSHQIWLQKNKVRSYVIYIYSYIRNILLCINT